MLTRTIFAVVLFAVLKCCHAQPLPVVSVVLKSASGIPDPSSISGLKYWWVASDNTTNTAVTNWIDRISGSIWTNGATSQQPTNSATGIGYNGSTWLTNTVPWPINSGSGHSTIVFIFTPNPPQGVFGNFLGKDSGGSGIGAGASTIRTFGLLANVQIYSYVSGRTYDFAIVNTNGGSNNDVFFTNSVPFLATPTIGGSLFKYNGSDALANNYIGKVQEIIYYTNDLSQASISTIHTYATNKYNFSP